MSAVDQQHVWRLRQRDTDHDRRLIRLARLSSAVVAIVGVLALVGWQFEIELLKRVHPTIVAMNPMTAIGFLATSMALWMTADDGDCSHLRRRIAIICATAVTAVGLIKLLAFLGVDLRIDQWLFESRLAEGLHQYPNRMAPNTALCFLLIGSAFLLHNQRTRWYPYPSQILTLTTAMIALLALVGYIYSASAFYGVASFIPMAVHTAAGFLILSLGVLAARPREGIMSLMTSATNGGVLARRFVPVVIILPLVLSGLRVVGERAGLYDTTTGLSLLTVTSILVVLVIIWWTANQLRESDEARRDAERAVRDSEQLLRSIIDNNTGAIYVKDPSGRYQVANRLFQMFTGRATHEMLGRTDGELFPEALAEALRQGDEDVLASATSMEFEQPIPFGGLSRTYLTIKFPLRDEDGKAAAVCGISTDVTERRLVEDAMHRHAEQISDLYHKAPCGYHSLDEHGVFREINETELSWLGYTRDEIVGRMNFADVLTPKSRRGFAERFPIFKTEGAIRECEFEVVRKDGSTMPVLLSATAVYDDEGNFLSCRSTVFDITERRQATAANALLAAIVEHTSDAVIGLDLEGRIQSWNRGAEALYGYSAAEMIGQPVAQLRLPDSRSPLARALSGESVVNYEMVHVRRDGQQVHVSVTLSPIRNEQNEIIGVSKIARDVTSHREIQLQLEQANKMKSAFLANMSHEIRTPMTAIMGYADLLLDVNLSPNESLNTAKIIRRNAGHLLDIINDILDISKIEAGELHVERIRCSPNQIIHEVISLMQMRATAKNLELKMQAEGLIPDFIHTDPTRLRQILLNLVGNAIKFTESGRVKLVVQMMSDEAGDAEPMLRFDVIDTGIGMTSDQVARLFQPFSQADDSTTRQYGGTGLGLYISRRLAQMLNGEIEVNSIPGRGSTFSIVIPTGPLENAKQLSTCSDVIERSEPSREPGERIAIHGRILLADDSHDNRALLGKYLRLVGADVVEAENGAVACDMVLHPKPDEPPIDLILLDMQMPELDGYGAAKLLRSSGFDKPIIALTAHAMADDREKCLVAGCTDYLSKPLSGEALVRAVAQHLESPKRLNDAETASAAEPVKGWGAALPDAAIEPYLDAYIDSMSAKISELRSCLAKNDMDALRQIAHQIKGSGGLFGFTSMADLAAELENALQQGASLEQLKRQADQLIESMHLVSSSTKRRLAEAEA